MRDSLGDEEQRMCATCGKGNIILVRYADDWYCGPHLREAKHPKKSNATVTTTTGVVA